MKTWMYNEFKQCGVNYTEEYCAASYNENHQKFRDYEKEFDEIMNFISLENPQGLDAIDLGCGTGAISLYVAKKFKKVYSIDVSKAMMGVAQKRLCEKDAQVIEFHNNGFLSYIHKDTPVDVVFTKAALHHLPDFWKQIALNNINKMLKINGVLYIFDIVFGFPSSEYDARIDTWIGNFTKIAGPDFKAEIETHIRDEFSTFRWVIDGMLERAGFKIVNCRSADDFITEYYCEKIRDL